MPPAPRYTVTFQLSTPVAAGTAWTVEWGTPAVAYSTTNSTLTISGVLASTGAGYKVTVLATTTSDRLTEYKPTTPSFNVPVTADTPVPVTFSTLYWVSISAVGPGSVTISAPGAPSVMVTTGNFYATGSQNAINATPSENNVFVSWAGTGSGSYSGSQASWQVKVSGPISEVATFAAPAPQATTVTSIWTEPYLIAGLAIAGLAVGLIVGVLIVRARGGKPPASGGSSAASTSPPDESGTPTSGDAWSETSSNAPPPPPEDMMGPGGGSA